MVMLYSVHHNFESESYCKCAKLAKRTSILNLSTIVFKATCNVFLKSGCGICHDGHHIKCHLSNTGMLAAVPKNHWDDILPTFLSLL